MLKSLTLLFLLIFAAYFDRKEHRIPNPLIVTGVFTGCLFCHTISDMLLNFLAVFFLFFLGMLPLMGNGDLKLWMVLVCYLGFLDSCWVMGLSAALLVLYGFVKNRKETIFIFRHIAFSLQHGKLPQTVEQKSYPFAPFILISFILLWAGGVIL